MPTDEQTTTSNSNQPIFFSLVLFLCFSFFLCQNLLSFKGFLHKTAEMGCSESSERSHSPTPSEEEESRTLRFLRMANEYKSFLSDKATQNMYTHQAKRFCDESGTLVFRSGYDEELKELGCEEDGLNLETHRENGTWPLFNDIGNLNQWVNIKEGFEAGQQQWVEKRDLEYQGERWEMHVPSPITNLGGLLILKLHFAGDTTEFSLQANITGVYPVGRIAADDAWGWYGPWWYVLEALHDPRFNYNWCIIVEEREETPEALELPEYRRPVVSYMVYGVFVDGRSPISSSSEEEEN